MPQYLLRSNINIISVLMPPFPGEFHEDQRVTALTMKCFQQTSYMSSIDYWYPPHHFHKLLDHANYNHIYRVPCGKMLFHLMYVAEHVIVVDTGASPCALHNGGCSHICLRSATAAQRRCVCPNIGVKYSLSPDGRTCILTGKFLCLQPSIVWSDT